MKEEVLQVVGQIGQTDLCLCPSLSNGPDEQAHARLLVREDVLDPHPNGRLPRIRMFGPGN